MKRLMLFVLIMFPCFTLTACNTVGGVGEDLQGASQTVKGWF